jgi:hydrogenase maturation protein HypF
VNDLKGARLHINGIVQGVGFRPFVYGLAERLALTGWVRNTSAGVDIQVDGTESALKEFSRALEQDAPPLALIASLEVESCPPNGFSSFEIVHSEPIPGAFQPISPDVSICQDCLFELFDETDRRYRFPFINCTNCGPRLTIIQDIPYDRPKTTMAPFELCPECASEYQDPKDRRFHAQPVACAECGPHIWLEYRAEELGDRGEVSVSPIPNPQLLSTKTIVETQKLLTQGQILAIKGLGGFHLACDATNPKAVAELRRRKLRVDKPFALMMPDIETIEEHCCVSKAERDLLSSRERPIVLLDRKPESTIANEVAPGQNSLGVMLPYTPLHYLLLCNDGRQGTKDKNSLSPVTRHPSVLVMTSGNLSEEPIATGNQEARERLGDLADAFLMHNRDIHVRCDDSVVRVVSDQYPVTRKENFGQLKKLTTDHSTLYTLRRSRGYAPYPILLHRKTPPILATGPELKNTFCLTKERYAFLSHHIGDLENYETLQSFEEGIAHFERLFRIQPQMIAYDLHPNYLATRYALERADKTGITPIGVQHHHAHIAACMAEHGLDGQQPVIGVAFDGTGYGDDGAIWGGEFLLTDYRGYHRHAHLAYTPLPGGDNAVRQPWRMALSWLQTCGIPWDDELPAVQFAANSDQKPENSLAILENQLKLGTNAPPTSSMGRSFDAAAALIGVRQTVNYEAQAAIELEALVDPDESNHYPLSEIQTQSISPAPIFSGIINDLKAGVPSSTIAARFHNSIAHMVNRTCLTMRSEYNINQVVLSGGVWQNMSLLKKSLSLLSSEGFSVLVHEKIPTNDGGLALGQAIVAAHTTLE